MDSFEQFGELMNQWDSASPPGDRHHRRTFDKSLMGMEMRGGGGGDNQANARAGGGGSYNAGENQNNESGVNQDHGQVIIIMPTALIELNNQEVAAGQSSVIPLDLNILIPDFGLESIVFLAEVTPVDDAPAIEGDLGVYVLDSGTNSNVVSNGAGSASVAISGFNPNLNGSNPDFARTSVTKDDLKVFHTP